MIHRVTMSNKKWQWVVQRVTMNNNDWQKWQLVVQQMSASDNEWRRMTASDKTNENGTIHIEEWMIVISDACNESG